MSSSSRPPKPQSTLDAFISSRRKPVSEPVFTSSEIHDRGSVFVANIYHANTQQEAKARVDQMKAIVHSTKPATHEMSAWRCMVPKPGRSGLGGPEDFELQSGSKDDGERWAGGKILNVMETLGILDAVIIVSRWYGGELLGPARFSHIEECAMEVARKFKDQEELVELRALLETLDDLLATLREEHQQLSSSTSAATPSSSTDSPQASSSSKISLRKPNYASLDIAKARRLIRARESAINSVKTLLAKLRENSDQPQIPEVTTS
ncbi:hypothetical protein H1R20_g14410, partial [Candolleomyces eurysporus]